MKSLTGAIVLAVYVSVIISTSGMSVGKTVGKTWCRAPLRRNWRLPPHPEQPPRPKPKPSEPLGYFRELMERPLPGRPHIALFQHINQRGFKYEQDVGNRCYNLPNVINDQASSLDTHGRCVMICRDRDCKFCKKMKPGSPGHFDLNEIGMDDIVTSIKPCTEVYDRA